MVDAMPLSRLMPIGMLLLVASRACFVIMLLKGKLDISVAVIYFQNSKL